MIAALAGLWQVYVAKQGFSRKYAELPKSNLAWPALQKMGIRFFCSL
jgi:hypothetical protein